MYNIKLKLYCVVSKKFQVFFYDFNNFNNFSYLDFQKKIAIEINSIAIFF